MGDNFDDILKREGEPTNDPNDRGGRTAFGISERSHPEAWADGKVTEAEAREIYLQKYVVGPGFHLIPPTHAKLQAQLIDFGFHSGPAVATMKLQAILKVDVDGVFGPQTLAAISTPLTPAIENQLVAARVTMIGKILSRDPSQLKYVNGWLARALSFLV